MNYYVIWIEGLSVKKGEKLKTLSPFSHSYTTKMTEAMRIREYDIPVVLKILKEKNFAPFVINEQNTFIRTTYIPKGTLYGFS